MEDPTGHGAASPAWIPSRKDGRDLPLVFAGGRHQRGCDRDRARSTGLAICGHHGLVHLDRHSSRLRQGERHETPVAAPLSLMRSIWVRRCTSWTITKCGADGA